MLGYRAAYDAIEDGWFIVRVLDFLGMISPGKNIEHSRKMIQDALCLMAEYKPDQGAGLPKPRLLVRDKKAILLERVKLRAKVERASGADTFSRRSGERE